jgi:hypothetical protein
MCMSVMPVSQASSSGGFTTDSDVLYQGSVDFLQIKEYLYEVALGVAGDLSRAKGMAGDDTTAHNFAKTYEPAAKTLVQGIGQAGEAMATIAARLLEMAKNYLEIEDVIARMFTAVIQVASALAKAPSCEPSEAYLQLPMVTGSAEVHEMWLIGKFWPQGNPEELRLAAQTWAKAADLLDNAQQNAARAQDMVATYCAGKDIDAFVTFGKTLYTARPSGGRSVSSGAPLLENLSGACRSLSTVCQNYSDHIEETRTKIIEIGVTIGVVTAAGIALTVFTFGGSDAAAAAADAAAVAEAAEVATALEVAAATDVVATTVATAEIPVIEAEIAELAAQNVIAQSAAAASQTLPMLGAAVVLGGAAVLAPNSAEAATRPVTLPPMPAIPPRVPPAFRLYSPLEQAETEQWAQSLPASGPSGGSAEDIAYQLRVAGNPERIVPGVNPTDKVHADGIRPTDGALVEAKYVRELGCSPRNLADLQTGDFITGRIAVGDDDEMRRYASALNNPANPVQFVEIDTNDPQTVGYWQFLAARHHMPSDVRVVP